MNSFNDLSIKTKFISTQVFGLVLTLVFFLGVYTVSEYRHLEENTYARMTILADVLGSNSISALLFFDNAAANDVLESLSTQPDILTAAIFDHNDSLFAEYRQGLTHQLNRDVDYGEYRKDGHLILHRPILFDGSEIGSIALRLDPDIQAGQVRTVVLSTFLLFAAGLVFVFFISLKTQQPVTEGILSLAALTKRVRDSGDYSQRIERKTNDEIGTLISGFNDMMATISDTEKNLEKMVQERTRDLEAARLRAEESDHLKSAFLASMSHELRTPLNSIIGFSGILLQEKAGKLNEEQKEQLNIVRNSSTHLLDLINDVLDISKIESGHITINPETFNVDLWVGMACSALRPLADKKGLSLEYDIEPDIPDIYSDKRRVEQIVINLINNSIKFTETGGVKVYCYPDDGFLVVKVIDTGIGIKEEDFDTIFSTFRQVGGDNSANIEGTGLGLSICKKLSELLGGSIKVESKFGKGSSFTVRLPLEYKEDKT
ncbi:MAG: HAMP domain-containing protein [Candidatus Marinimicrobia bacterium]|nr:HAMP domain-containing protein [Candidatus Neomarinimicrobiota bacterium]MCF7903882.1 HAMP domain-containing protein [Candidatus Neomarinimicrobiota bacterium]